MPIALSDIRISKRDVEAELARRRHLDFMQFCWDKPSEPFVIGTHTRKICAAIDRAIDRYKQGKSTYLAIKVPPRHGKSQIVSRALPAHFIGQFPDDDVITVSYASSLSEEFSRDCKDFVRSEHFRELYPNIELSQTKNSNEQWEIAGHFGKLRWVGFEGGVTGKGANLAIIDDIFKNREAANSAVQREAIWREFSDSIMTRLAPVHIVIILATPWHIDDLFGRINQCIIDDPLFPRFEELSFPAQDDQGAWLFPERFPASWYEAQRAVLSRSSWSALFMCNPVPEGGNLLSVSDIKYYTEPPADVTMCWGWDLASTEAQLTKSDPDYTVGIYGGVRKIPTAIPGVMQIDVYVDRMIRGRWEALGRDGYIKKCALETRGSRIGIEAFGGYKDTYTTMRNILAGISPVEEVRIPSDKATRVDSIGLRTAMEGGHFHINGKIVGLQELLKELEHFPSGTHDDIVDAIVCMIYVAMQAEQPIIRWASENIITDISQLPESESDKYISIAIRGAIATILTARWYRYNGVLAVTAEKTATTTTEIADTCTGAKCVILPEEADSSGRSLYSELSKIGMQTMIMVDSSYAVTPALFYINQAITNRQILVSSTASETLIALQQDNNAKNLSAYTEAMLHYANFIFKSNVPGKDKPYRPFWDKYNEAKIAPKQAGSDWA